MRLLCYLEFVDYLFLFVLATYYMFAYLRQYGLFVSV